MLQLVRGTPEAVSAACVQAYRSSASRSVWVAPSCNDRRAWAQLRHVLPQLRRLVGGPAMEEALARHRVEASLVLGRLEQALTGDERRQRAELAASLTSHLTHNWYIERPFLDGLSELLYELLTRAGATLIVPQLSALEDGTYALLKSMCRLHPGFQPELWVGYTPGFAEQEVDAHGIAWGRAAEHVEHLRVLLCAQLASETREAPPPGASAALETGPADSLDDWDDDVDGRALEALATVGRPLEAHEEAAVVEAAERAFAAFDRSAALRFAVSALEHCPGLGRPRAATLHEIVSLSAHNRQFGSEEGDERFNAFVEQHLRQALALEEEPELRLCLCYRLAVTLGRRGQAHAVAMAFANQVVEGARRAPLPEARRAYQEAWGRNIRAYLHMRQRDFAAAFADGERAFTVLAPFTEAPSPAWRDAAFTRVVLADNMEVLSGAARDEGQREAWLRENFALEAQNPEGYGARFSAHRRALLFGQKHELDIALQAARQGLEDARRERSLSLSYCYLMELGALHYRQGHALEALARFEEARDIARGGLLKDARALSTSERFLARAALQAGRPEAARECYQRLLDTPEGASRELRPELLQGLALAAARQGQGEDAEHWVDEAIDLARGQGTRGALVAVARTAGSVCQWLGRPREAGEAYRRGWELVAAGGEDGLPLAASHKVALLVGLAEVDASGRETVLAALHALPEALQQEPEAWWYLPRLLRLVVRRLAEGGLEVSAGQEPLATLLRAASQREDCGPLIERVPPREVARS